MILTASAPAEIQVSDASGGIWQSAAAATDFSATLSRPAVGEDLVIHVRWASEAPKNALRVQFRQNAQTLTNTTLWGGPETTEAVFLPALPQ